MIFIRFLLNKFWKYYFNLSNQIQLIFLRCLGSEIDSSVKVYGKFTWIGDPRNLKLGRNVTINQGVHFNLSDKVVIGENVRISTNVQFHTGKLKRDINNMEHITDGINIGKNSWIASSVVISPGVKICDNCLVLANSVVIKSLKKSGRYGGIPVKLITNFD